MTDPYQEIKAIHLGDGNYFDNMRIDISESHKRFSSLPRHIKSIKKPKCLNLFKLFLSMITLWLGLREFLVLNGLSKKWLDDFRSYWSKILNGRPFGSNLDFFMLLHDYRKRQQYTSQLNWDHPEQHIANWQNPDQIYSTLHFVRKITLNPVICLPLWKRISRSASILEYGCALAPYYYCYRNYFSYLECTWVLADIPNFPFHYAKYLYRNDKEVDFITIDAEDFTNPLGKMGKFDVIILTTVLEHLYDPLFVSEYLLERLKPGGLFIFDYIKSEGLGLDHPKAVEMREKCLKNILEKTQLIHGRIDDINQSINLCIMKKKPV